MPVFYDVKRERPELAMRGGLVFGRPANTGYLLLGGRLSDVVVPTAKVGGHKPCDMEDCENLGIDLVLHEKDTRAAAAALQACEASPPPAGCATLLARYTDELAKYVDAADNYSQWCEGYIFQGRTPPGCKRLDT